MALATLSIDMVAKLANFERDLGQMARIAEQKAASIQKAMGIAGRAIGALVGGVTVGALTAMTRAQIDAIDRFNDLKDATGASIENVSALDSIARRTGHTFEAVGTSLIKFNAALKDAGDNDKGRVFKALGLDVEKLKALDPAEALRQTAVALTRFADDGNKARAVYTLFGKSLQEAMPFLNDLAESGELVAKTTTEQAAAADKFNKELFRMQANLTDVGRSLTMSLIVPLNASADAMRKSREEFGLLEGAMRAFSSSAPSNVFALPGALLRMWEQMIPGVKPLKPSAAESFRRSELNVKNLPTMPSVADTKTTKPAGAKPEDKWWLERRAEWLRKYDEQERERKEIEDRAARDLAGWMDRWAAEGDAMSRRLAADERAVERMASLNAELDSLSGRTGDDRKRALTEALETRLNAGEKFRPEELERIVNGIAGITKATDDAKNNATELGAAFTSALDDVLFRAKDVGDVVKGLAQNILSIGLQKSVTSKLGSKLGDWFSSFLPFADGGVMTGAGPVPLRTYSKGGIASSPQVALFGEGSTPEAYVPLPDGRRIPVAMKGSGGRPVVVNINQTVGDVATISQLAASNQALKRDLMASMRRAEVYGG